jgi:type IV pilus assembly protein PilV
MKKSNGFSLIEVLVAMVILAIGLLGLAALQASSLKNNQTAYYRSLATQLSYDIADRMRANRLSGGKYLDTYMKPSAAKDQSAHCLKVTATCTPAKMAEHDLFEWNTALKSLPDVDAKIEFDKSYKVTITWDEKRNDNLDGKANSRTKFEMAFQL